MKNVMLNLDVKLWLMVKGYTQAQIARDIGIIEQTVWKTINGRERNRKVLAWLEKHGYSATDKTLTRGENVCNADTNAQTH